MVFCHCINILSHFYRVYLPVLENMAYRFSSYSYIIICMLQSGHLLHSVHPLLPLQLRGWILSLCYLTGLRIH